MQTSKLFTNSQRARQLGFFDPVSGLMLLIFMGLTGATLNSTVEDTPPQAVVSVSSAHSAEEESL